MPHKVRIRLELVAEEDKEDKIHLVEEHQLKEHLILLEITNLLSNNSNQLQAMLQLKPKDKLKLNSLKCVVNNQIKVKPHNSSSNQCNRFNKLT